METNVTDSVFTEHNITGDVLVYLNQRDLGEIGIYSVGHRLRILKAIYAIIKDQDLDIKDHYVPPSMYHVSCNPRDLFFFCSMIIMST